LFSNIIPGPVVSITHLDMKQDIMNDLLNKYLYIVAYITDKQHPAFKMFQESRPLEKPVAVFITIQYIEVYD
jgi:hypothetical protein